MSSAIQQAKNYAKYNNDLLMSNTRQAQAYNAAEAAKNRDWQERLANSAHQREVADLKKAGLNPVLSAGGQGATTGSGASASSDAAGVDTSMVGAVIDMATAQLNSATQLQATAMQTAASIANNIRDNDTARYKWNTPSADSTIGQVMRSGSIIDNLITDASSSKFMAGLSSKARGLFNKKNVSGKDKANAFIALTGLPGAIVTDRTVKTDKKYKGYYSFNKRTGKPKTVVNKSGSLKGSGIGAVYRNTVADKYSSSKSYRNKYKRNQYAMNIHYRKY